MAAMSKLDFGMIDWTDAQLDAMFLRSEAKPLEGLLNADEHHVDLDAHEIYNDRRWKGFMPKDLPVTDVTARLTLGFSKRLWKQKTRAVGETQYYGGSITTRHTVDEITLERDTHDLPPGRYVLLGYTAPVFKYLFYDLLKPISDDVMLFRGYTGKFPDGKRGWTALLLRRYPFAYMGIDDHEVLFGRGAAPSDDDLLGAWRVDALYYANEPAPMARILVDRAGDHSLQVHCDTSISRPGLLLSTLVSDHFQTAQLPALQQEMRIVDRQYLVGKWTTDLRGASAKFLLAGSPGLFHSEKGPGRASRLVLYYLLTRLT
jgi:hypothetical protein